MISMLADRTDRRLGESTCRFRERSELGDKLLTYYFDVCFNRVIQKADPRLLIEGRAILAYPPIALPNE